MSQNAESPDYIPTIFPNQNKMKPKARADLKRFERRVRRELKTRTNEDITMFDMESARIQRDAFCQTEPDAIKPGSCQSFHHPTVYADSPSATEKATFALIPSQTKFATTLVQTDKIPPPSFLELQDKEFVAFTGISRNVCQFLLYRIGSNVKDCRGLSREMKLVMVLVRLKSNLSYINLKTMFKTSLSSVKKVFVATLNALLNATKEFVIWFDRKSIQARLPPSFRGLFPNTRAIIDASEVECSSPSKPDQRVKMDSHYKSRFTVKYLVACAPSGEIMFVSKGFGGRTTDTEITVRSGFLQLIEPGDHILADKGFPSIEARVLEKGGLLVMPPFKKGQSNFQFSKEQNENGYNISRVRIHVERCIARMKRFQVLDYVKADMREYFDDSLVIISGLCNLCNDLISQE